ncbi:DUF4442 domain-containing protein [Tenacibaculum aestuariivivum]|uniref:DUF4442 domain-containing protein n=1 Tax=Tenacibaculum aestuariivivum TaxID=2006131 RepID=UPI003AB5655A
MKFTPLKINLFTFLKLPSAYICGVRVLFISEEKSLVKVTHRWINQNPFKSMFWAVQGMAAELATGILVMQAIDKSEKKISMLVTNMNATFTKKAKGKISFECDDGEAITKAIQKSVNTGHGQTVIVTSKGINDDGVLVSKFQFEWSLKVKA